MNGSGSLVHPENLMDHIAALIARIRLFYDPTREPLRRRVYTYLLLIAGMAASAGLIAGSLPVVLAGPLAAALAVPVVEKARSLVTPVAAPDLTDTPGRHSTDRGAA